MQNRFGTASTDELRPGLGLDNSPCGQRLCAIAHSATQVITSIMQCTEPSELEDKVGLLRSARMLWQTGADVSEPAGSFRLAKRAAEPDLPRLNGRVASAFGDNLTVARLFAVSPPEASFLADVTDAHDTTPAFSLARRSKAEPVARSGADADDAGARAAAPALAFAREPVVGAPLASAAPQPSSVVPSGIAPSGIARLLRADAGQAARPAAAQKEHGHLEQQRSQGRSCALTLYLPDQTSVELEAAADATVAQVMEQLVQRVKSERPAQLRLEAAAYELRIHDEDGLPDTDFPALDAAMRIGNFCEDLRGEFCICQRPGADARGGAAPATPTAAGNASAGLRNASAEPASQSPVDDVGRALADRNIAVIKVFLPESGFRTTVHRVPGITAADVLGKVQPKQRLPLFTEEYEFSIPEADRVALSRASVHVSMQTDLFAAGISNLELKRRVYADAPAPKDAAAAGATERLARGTKSSPAGAAERETARQAVPAVGKRRGGRVVAAIHVGHHSGHQQSGSANEDAIQFNPDNFLFNPQTAALYQQWNVYKTNKNGKRQRRVLGIDEHKIYNRRQEKDMPRNAGAVSAHGVKRPERLISDIVHFGISKGEPGSVEICWRDANAAAAAVPLELATIKYEILEGPEAAAFIVAKLKYIVENRAQ